jgi:transglutaminase-like putative cysteine protease
LKTAGFVAAFLVLTGLGLLLPGSLAGKAECISFQGVYDLYLTHTHVSETMGLRYDDPSARLSGQNLYPIPGLHNVTFRSEDTEISSSYNGTYLQWNFHPPLSPGDVVVFTREWDVHVAPDPDGFRDLALHIGPTDDAHLRFNTHDVDVIETSLPVDPGKEYSGNVSHSSQYVRYSSTYKLYSYQWQGRVENSGSVASRVSLNVSIPWDGGYQHVIQDVAGNVGKDALGNRQVRLSMDLEPGSSSNVSAALLILTETWTRGPEAALFASLGDPAGFLDPDGDYWQAEDPRIIAFAMDAAEDLAPGMSPLVALDGYVTQRLTYGLYGDRQGALWALLNGKGSCKEYSDLLIASARSMDIPSLYVSGVTGRGEQGDAGHAWAMAHLDKIGWVGVDPTWGYVGTLDSGRLAVRFCNPDDVGFRLGYVSGEVLMADWGERWDFEELTGPQAENLLGISEAWLAAPAWVLVVVLATRVLVSTRR